MKWVKVAIGAVIAIISIGIVATSVYKMTQEIITSDDVTIEILTLDKNNGFGSVTPDTYNKLKELYDNVNNITDWEVTLNDIPFGTVGTLTTSPLYESVFYFSDSVHEYHIGIGDMIYEVDLFEEGYVIKVSYELTTPPQLSGISATLILLAPLIFAGGVLAYLLNKQEL